MAFDESLNTRHISTNLRNYEAARSAFFVLTVDGIDNLVSPSYKGEINSAAETDMLVESSERLRLNVTKAFVPNFEVGTGSYRRGNDVVNFATTPTWSSGTIEVDDVVGLDTKSILEAWLYLAYNPHTRKGGRMADYKKTATLSEYTQDYQLIRTWTLEGCFITQLSEDDFDRENDGKRKIRATIVYDRAIVELPKVVEVD